MPAALSAFSTPMCAQPPAEPPPSAKPILQSAIPGPSCAGAPPAMGSPVPCEPAEPRRRMCRPSVVRLRPRTCCCGPAGGPRKLAAYRSVNHRPEGLNEPYGVINSRLLDVPGGPRREYGVSDRSAGKHRVRKRLSALERPVPALRSERDLAVEAGAGARVAGRARAGHGRLQPEDVLVAIHAHLAHGEDVAALLALLPEAPARAAPEMGNARLERECESLGIHPGEHQYLAAAGVGDDGRDQAVRVELGLKHESLLDLGGRAAPGEPRLRSGSHENVSRRGLRVQTRGPCTICRKRSR